MPVTPPTSGGTDGDPQAILTAFEERTVVVEALADEVTSLVTEVRGLRAALARRPPRREVERKRRLTALAVAVWSLLLIFVHDVHVEHCGPGSRTEAVVQAFLNGEDDFERLRAASMPDSAFLCDLTFPLHSHDSPPREAAPAIILGVVLYGAAITGGVWWAMHPGGMTRRDEAEEAEEVAALADTQAGRGSTTEK